MDNPINPFKTSKGQAQYYAAYDAAIVMGLSRGAWLAMNLALLAPERLEQIVLLSPAAALISFNSFFSGIVQAVMRLPMRWVAKMALHSQVAPGFMVNPIYSEQFVTGMQNWNWEVNKNGYSGIMPCKFSDDELRQICHPTLLLIGDRDRINPPQALQRATQMMDHLEGDIISNAGHLLSMEQPDKVNAIVLSFLTKESIVFSSS